METKTLTLVFEDIVYDLDGVKGFDHYSEGRTREEVLRELPSTDESELEITLEDFSGITFQDIEAEIDEVIEDEIEGHYGWIVDSCKVTCFDETGAKILSEKHDRDAPVSSGVTEEEILETIKQWKERSWKIPMDEYWGFCGRLTEKQYLTYFSFYSPYVR